MVAALLVGLSPAYDPGHLVPTRGPNPSSDLVFSKSAPSSTSCGLTVELRTVTLPADRTIPRPAGAGFALLHRVTDASAPPPSLECVRVAGWNLAWPVEFQYQHYC